MTDNMSSVLGTGPLSMKYRLFLITFFLIMSFPCISRGDDPSIKWKEIRTDHFNIIFPLKYVKTAQKMAVITEQTHQLVASHMGWAPSTKTTVILTPYTDSANGWATTYFRNTVNVYLTDPGDFSELNQFDDWLWLLFLHEYTHIIHMDTSGLLPSIINSIIGKVWVPNSIQPSFVLEGMAIFSESRFSGAGRNQSSIYDMYMRSSVYDNRIYTLAEISNSISKYPRGLLPYLYGSRFIKFISNRYSPLKIKHLSAAYGSQNIPFGLNKSAVKSYGKSFEVLYSEFVKYIDSKYKRQISAIKSRGLIRGKRLTYTGEYKYYPSWNPSNSAEIALIDNDGITPSSLKILTLNKSRNKVISKKIIDAPVYEGGWPRWHHGKIFFHKLAYFNTVYNYLDLYRVKPGKKPTRLTEGKRLASVTVSPDGKSVAAVRHNGTNHDLVLLGTDYSVKKVLKKSGLYYTVIFSPDSNYLAYSSHKNASRIIQLYNLKTAKTIDLPSLGRMNIHPAFSPDGKFIFFSADGADIYNIYRYEIGSGKIKQITNVIAGAFMPSVSPDGKKLLYMGYSVKGYDLFVMDLKEENFLSSWSSLYEKPLSMLPELKINPLKYNSYNFLKYMFPVLWTADYGYSMADTFSVSAMGYDPLEHHIWSLDASWSDILNTAEIYGSWSYNRLKFPISFEFYYGHYNRGDFFVNDHWNTYRWHYTQATLSSVFPLQRDFGSNFSAFTNLNLYRGIFNEEMPVILPDTMLPRHPDSYYSSTIKAGAYYFNATSSSGGLDWENGYYLYTSIEGRYRGSYDTYDALIRAEAMLRRKIPIGDHTVVTVKFQIGRGINTDYPVFSIGNSAKNSGLSWKPWSLSNYLSGFSDYQKTGESYYTSQAYVTFPLDVSKGGFSTVPVFLRRLSFKFFASMGNAFNSLDVTDEQLISAGGELRFQLVQGYGAFTDFILGISKGFGEHGETMYYFSLGSPLPEDYFYKFFLKGRN
ncbi:MAG: PD40 domain-containing protein [Deltaproteobacteria bacterium]|nr:PD40 domain-containing protein [Deltaproteobacteria bacterium]